MIHKAAILIAMHSQEKFIFFNFAKFKNIKTRRGLRIKTALKPYVIVCEKKHKENRPLASPRPIFV